MLIWLLVLVGIYIAYNALLFAMQRRMIFPRHVVPHTAEPEVNSIPMERWWIESEEGDRVEAWFFQGKGVSEEKPGPLVYFAHGNAELIDHHLGTALTYADMGANVLLVEYRGYGRTEGAPGQREITTDAVAMLERATARDDVDGSRVVYHGRSIGGGVVCSVARERAPSVLILESAFTSVRSMALRYGAIPWVVQHPFRNDETVAEFEGPILLFHGSDDRLITPKHARKLESLAKDAKLVWQPGGHLEFPSDAKGYWREIREFLREKGILEADRVQN